MLFYINVYKWFDIINGLFDCFWYVFNGRYGFYLLKLYLKFKNIKFLVNIFFLKKKIKKFV